MKIDLSKYKQEQIDTAIGRMVNLGLSNEIIENFKKGIVMTSLSGKPGKYIVDTDNVDNAVKSMERSAGDYLPYHIIKSHTVIGDQFAILYVSENRMHYINADDDFLPAEIPDDYGDVVAWLYNAAQPQNANCEKITIKSVDGAIIRIG